MTHPTPIVRLDSLPAGTAFRFPISRGIAYVGSRTGGSILGGPRRAYSANTQVIPLPATETATLLAAATAAQDIASAAEHAAARARGAAMDADQGAFLTYNADPTATTWLAYLATTDRYIAADRAWHQAQEDLTAADRALTIAARAHQVALAREAEAAPCS